MAQLMRHYSVRRTGRHSSQCTNQQKHRFGSRAQHATPQPHVQSTFVTHVPRVLHLKMLFFGHNLGWCCAIRKTKRLAVEAAAS